MIGWCVITKFGTRAFKGSREECLDYVRTAIKKGAPLGFLYVTEQQE